MYAHALKCPDYRFSQALHNIHFATLHQFMLNPVVNVTQTIGFSSKTVPEMSVDSVRCLSLKFNTSKEGGERESGERAECIARRNSC